MKRLAEKGIVEFRSLGSQAYCDALLRGKGPLQSGLPAIEYRKLLAAEDQDFAAMAALEDCASAPSRRTLSVPPPPEVPQQPLEDVGAATDNDSIFGGGSQAGESDIVGGDRTEEDAPTERPSGGLPPGFSPEIQGMRVVFVPGRSSATHRYADRLSVRCCNPAHQRCNKSRSLALLRDRFGPQSAERYLGAWMAKAFGMDASGHCKYQPKVADIEAFVATQS